jgi:hypothetical protein
MWRKVRKSRRWVQAFGLMLMQPWQYNDPIENHDATAQT